MKWAFLLLFCCGFTLGAADPAAIRTVYLLPMSHSLDQYLANRLTGRQVLEVVTDPKRADAVLTDHIGKTFEDRLTELLPPPTPPKEKRKDKDSESGSDYANANDQPAGFMASYSGGGKGTVFLVDLKSRHVVWSTYEKPKDYSAHQLDKTADRMVTELKKARTPKKAAKGE